MSFPDDIHSESNPTEVFISRQLWRWAFAEQEEQQQILEEPDGLLFTLEFYLCELLQLSPIIRKKNWWCDGVVDLAVNRLDRTTFCIGGAAWNPGQLTAFQLEYHFEKRRAIAPHKIFLRFGETDHNGQILRYPPSRFDLRPDSSRARTWMIDIEITSQRM